MNHKNRVKKGFCNRIFKQLSKFIDKNRSKIWILLVGLYVIPYILVVIGSTLFPSNNFFLVMAMLATSEGIGTLSYSIRRWCKRSVSDSNVRPSYIA